MRRSSARALALGVALALTGCTATAAPPPSWSVTATSFPLAGRVSFPHRLAQAEMAEVGNAATVSLLDATTGNTLGSSVTDASGNFVLTFDSLIPTNGSTYVLEAVKGLAVGGSSNRAGASAVRVRTLLFWDNGWKSLTNATPGTGIVVSSATTAVSTLVSLKKSAGTAITLTNLIGKINPADSTFNDGGTGLSSANDYSPVLTLVQNAIQLDQDPLGAIAFDPTAGTYHLSSAMPLVTSISRVRPLPGTTLTLKGANFDRLDGRNAFWFGPVQASTWSVSADKTTATVGIPSGAYAAPFLLQRPGGSYVTLSPFLKIRGTVGTIAGNGSASSSDGKGLDAQVHSPYGLGIDASGSVYNAGYSSHTIRKLTPSGVMTTLAGSGTSGSNNGTGTAASFFNPTGVAVDASGNVFVGGWNDAKIRQVTPAGVASTFAGSTYGHTDGPGTSAQFRSPNGVAFGASGNLFVADYANAMIRMITPAGQVSTYAGTGVLGDTDGATSSAQFRNPSGVTVASDGTVYVAEYPNHRLRKITPAGVVSLFAGNGTSGPADGTGTAARFNGPYHLAIDASDNVYVSDVSNHKIRKVTPAGVVTTLAGSGTSGYADGALTTAQFFGPIGIAVDPDGDVWIGDSNNQRIRVIVQ